MKTETEIQDQINKLEIEKRKIIKEKESLEYEDWSSKILGGDLNLKELFSDLSVFKKVKQICFSLHWRDSPNCGDRDSFVLGKFKYIPDGTEDEGRIRNFIVERADKDFFSPADLKVLVPGLESAIDDKILGLKDYADDLERIKTELFG